MNIAPSTYSWILPIHVDLDIVDRMATEGTFPTIGGLLPAIGYAVLFGIVRLVFQSILFRPLAIFCMKLKLSKDKPVMAADKLIKLNNKTKITTEQIRQHAALAGITEIEFTKYISNKRRNLANEKKIVKFSEAIWRAIFYTGFCALGYYALFVPETAIWVKDTKNHFVNWPYHPVSDAIQLYYLMELGCYIHQLMWTEVTRSDAMEMILHHFITIALILASYLTNYTRIGASILMVHDVADVFLEVGKVFNYASRVREFKWIAQPVTDTLFGLFAVTFFVSRLVIYPRFLLYSYLVESPAAWGGIWPGYWYFAVLLSSLQCLHIFWFYLICRMIVKLLKAGGIEKDERSDDEDDEDEKSVGSSGGGGDSKKAK